MKLEQIHQFTIDTDTINTATIWDKDKVAFFADSSLQYYDLITKEVKLLLNTNSSMKYTDGGFVKEVPCTIYTHDNIVVLVNTKKCHGYVYHEDRSHAIHLQRGEYANSVADYPIAIYNNDKGVPHLIYGEDWNHVQIMNLDTLQILTATKSLIEVNAEDEYMKYTPQELLEQQYPWPPTYDYFYGKLLMSPDNKMFLSMGWIWGSFDAYVTYDVKDFISNPKISSTIVMADNHDERPACWIDNTTIAIVQQTEATEKQTEAEINNQVTYYTITENDAIESGHCIVKDLDLLNTTMYYDEILDQLLFIYHGKGIVITTREGDILYQDLSIKLKSYCIKTRTFLALHENTVTIYKLLVN